MCSNRLFTGISIVTVPFIMVTFILLFPLSLMATGASLFWMIFWVPLAAIGLSSFTAVIGRWLAQAQLHTGLQRLTCWWGWFNIGAVCAYLFCIALRLIGGVIVDGFLEGMDSFLLAIALLSTLYNHMGLIRLYIRNLIPFMIFLWVVVFVCHLYGILYIYQVAGSLGIDAFVNDGFYLWLFIESVIFSVAGTLLMFMIEFHKKIK